MGRPELDRQRLVAVFMLGAALFNYPILSLFNTGAAVFGVPLLYVFIFVAWGGLIGLVAWVVERDA
jgi:hypothetical protein